MGAVGREAEFYNEGIQLMISQRTYLDERREGQGESLQLKDKSLESVLIKEQS